MQRLIASSIFLIFGTSTILGETITKSMDFDSCLRLIASTAAKAGVAPTNIVETPIMRVVRIPAPDGSLLVTCSKPDHKMILMPTTKQCGIDVEC